VVTVTDPSSGSKHTFSNTPVARRASLPASISDPPLTFVHAKEPDEEDADDEEIAGHDSPNWGKAKSYTILCACTILYAIIAEILVDTVDLVMDDLAVDEKFLGLTLFALVSWARLD
jgi:Ca2+:H+ antiporter